MMITSVEDREIILSKIYELQSPGQQSFQDMHKILTLDKDQNTTAGTVHLGQTNQEAERATLTGNSKFYKTPVGRVDSHDKRRRLR